MRGPSPKPNVPATPPPGGATRPADPAGADREPRALHGIRVVDLEAQGEWQRLKEALLDHVDAVRKDLDWDLRTKIRVLLAQVAHLVLLLPGAGQAGEAAVQAEIDALLDQVSTLRSRLGG